MFRASLPFLGISIASIFLSLPLLVCSRSLFRNYFTVWSRRLISLASALPGRRKRRRRYCQLCFQFDQFFSQAKRAEETLFRHYRTFKLLHDSATEGCELCRWLRSALILNASAYDILFDSEDQIKIFLTLGRTSIPEDPPPRAEIEVFCGNLSYVESYAEDMGVPQAWYQKQPGRSTLTRRPEVVPAESPAGEINDLQRRIVDAELDLAQEWLNNCLESHDICHSPSLGGPPMRLLYVGVKGHTPVLRLVRTTALLTARNGKRGVGYCALSYCWGRTAVDKHLSLANEQEYIENVKEDELPQTLRDAVHITRSLGVRYLWVDAYCIVQPTKEDSAEWSRESARMCDVYHNAVCTISATGARDSSVGCFIEHEWKRFPVGNCNLTSPNTSFGVREPFVLAPQLPSASSVSIAPINKRAWTFQERCLSLRILHWTKDGLFWECRRERASSEHLAPPQPIGLRLPTQAWEDSFPQITRETIAEAPSEGWDGFQWKWEELVSQYSTRNLTVLTDKLVALSGVARLFQPRFKDDYLAGLWRSTLPNSLLWSCYDGIDNCVNADEPYVAPSWSWASITTNVLVSWFETPIYKLHTLPGVQVNHETTFTSVGSADITGAVLYGQICLTLPFVNITQDYSKPDKGRCEGGVGYETLQPLCGPAGGVSYFFDPEIPGRCENIMTAFISWNNRGFHGLLLTPVSQPTTAAYKESLPSEDLRQYRRIGAVVLDLDLDYDERSAQNLDRYIDRWETLIII